MSLSISTLAHASEYKAHQPFKISATVSHFYGRTKTAEAALWADAFSFCEKLEPKKGGLLGEGQVIN
nr:hypothetical protein BdHM001_18040 [Bdellovibrio sp. HM001]